VSTLIVVEEVLKERGTPMVVRDIVIAAGERLPTKSRTPATVVARDLAMDIKKHGSGSRFTRTAPGLYTLRELADVIVAAPPMEGDVLLDMPPPTPDEPPTETGADA